MSSPSRCGRTARRRSPMVALRPVSAKVMRQSWMSLRRSSTFWPPSAEHEVVGEGLVVVQEVVLDGRRAVAQAEDEVAVPEVRVVAHHVPQDRPVADGHHRLGQRLRVLAQAQPEPAAEEDDLHRGDLRASTSRRGMATTSWPPQAATSCQLRRDLGPQVPGQDQDQSGRSSCRCAGGMDRDVRARREAAVLVGVAVDGEVEEVGAGCRSS